MSSDNKDLYPFLNPNGTTSQEGSRNAGEWQRQQGQQPSPQQGYESSEAYLQRVNGGNKS